MAIVKMFASQTLYIRDEMMPLNAKFFFENGGDSENTFLWGLWALALENIFLTESLPYSSGNVPPHLHSPSVFLALVVVYENYLPRLCAFLLKNRYKFLTM